MTSRALRMLDLSKRHPGISEGISQSFAEAARVCLDRHHTPPADFQLADNAHEEAATADWIAVDWRLKNAWANKDDATEYGAYAMALAAIELTRGLVAVMRAETRSGVDYYLGESRGDLDNVEVSLCFEVSGTDGGNAAAIRARLRDKVDQAARGRANLPAIACVVGFAARQIVSLDVVKK